MMKARVLLIAEAANPDWVSVPLVGWNIATHLRDVADVHIVTQIRNHEAFLRQGLVEGIDFSSIDTEAVAAPLYRLAEIVRGGSGKGWTTLTALQSLTYPYFERRIWAKFGSRIRSGEFDIVHRVTPLTPTAPSSLAARCRNAGVPFLLGPLNGGLPWPKEFSAERVKEKEWLSYVRGLYSLLPHMSSTYKNASAIIVGSRHTGHELSRYGQPLIYIPENAIDVRKFCQVSAVTFRQEKLRAAFVGRLVPYKGADIAIRACEALALSGRLTLDIIGDGPEMGSLRQLSANLKLDEAVRFHGWLPQSEVAEHLRSADVFVFPSVREFGGGVVLEAMASGAVPIIADYGGPGELVTDECGIKIPLAAKDIMVADFSAALANLSVERGVLSELSRLGKARVDHLYTWEAKAQQLQAVYDWVLSGCQSETTPSFPFEEMG